MIRAVAYCNWGRWVARCPRCPGAEHFGNEQGHAGGLFGDRFVCSTCTLACGVDWPPNVDAIARLLALRPEPNRNWLPGETIHDLLRENMENGCVPLDLDAGTETLISIVGDTVTAGYHLPAPERLALPRGGR